MDNESPVLYKLLSWRKNSEAFRKLFKVIWESGINPIKHTTEEFENQVEVLARMSHQGGNPLTAEEIKKCIIN